jgi:UbiD family decarboxylase
VVPRGRRHPHAVVVSIERCIQAMRSRRAFWSRLPFRKLCRTVIVVNDDIDPTRLDDIVIRALRSGC